VSSFPNNDYKGFSSLVEAEEYFSSSGRWSCGRGWSADANLLEKNNNQQFPDSVCKAESSSVKTFTRGNGVLVDDTSLKDSQSAEVKAEDCFDYLSLEPICDEPRDQERQYARFSSFSEMCELLCDIWAHAVSMDEINKPVVIVHKGAQSPERHLSLIDSDDDDSQLLHFVSESYLFDYLGLEKVKVSTTIMEERYFNSVYKLEFAGTSEGNRWKSGAGIVLRRPDDSIACKVMLGLGTMVKELAEFHALIFGLRASLDRGIYHIQVSVQFTLINRLREYLSDKGAMDLEKEANALINKFKLFLVKYEANVCITISSLANEAVGLP
ncbi:hypothetical protein KI387_005601, partial [Taxus chinensis]